MKTISKFILSLVIIFLWYFLSIIVYWACTNVAWIWTICWNQDICTNNGWCLCNWSYITSWSTCVNIIYPTKDNIYGIVSLGVTCTDVDWCFCTANTPSNVISNSQICSWIYQIPQNTLPLLSNWQISVSNTQAFFQFISTKSWNITYNGSCWNWSLWTVVSWTNTTVFNLSNWVYSNCQIRVTDISNNISSWLPIPSFTINYNNNTYTYPTCNDSNLTCVDGTYRIIVWWYACEWWNLSRSCSSYSSICSDYQLTCINGVYRVRDGYNCQWWNLGYSCSSYTPTCTNSELTCINGIYRVRDGYNCQWWNLGYSCSYLSTCTSSNLTCVNGIYRVKSWWYSCQWWNLGYSCSVSNSSLDDLLQTVEDENSTIYDYTPQWFKIRIYVPKYRNYLIKKTILSLNTSINKEVNTSLYNFKSDVYDLNTLLYSTNSVIYTDINSLVDTYNKFLWLLYIVLDLKKRDYLYEARNYFKDFFTQFSNFKKNY